MPTPAKVIVPVLTPAAISNLFTVMMPVPESSVNSPEFWAIWARVIPASASSVNFPAFVTPVVTPVFVVVPMMVMFFAIIFTDAAFATVKPPVKVAVFVMS